MNLGIERVAARSVEEIRELLARCDREGLRVAIAGGNTLRGAGATVAADVTLEMTQLDRIVEYEPADLTVAAQAGISLKTLNQTLARNGQFIPFDAPQPARATLGGTLAAGWLGPRRHLYGRPRDYVLGSTAILADGTVARAGGMVVKNVAGYDMTRLYVGSYGTLAVLAQANLKTLPQPAAARAFSARLPERTRTRAMAALRSLPVQSSAAWWVEGFHQSIDGDDGQEGRLFVLLETSDDLLERATRDMRSTLGRAGVPETTVIDSGARSSFERTIDAALATLGERSVTYRIAAFPDDAEPRAVALRTLAARFELRADSLVDINNGDIVLRASDLDAHALGAKIEIFDDALHDLEPRAQVIACDHPRRGDLNLWGTPPSTIDRMRALKARFDPNGTLNPGRFVGGI